MRWCCPLSPAHAQLEYIPIISVEITPPYNPDGVILLTTKDFHVRNGAPNTHPSTLQIIDPKEPWPPLFFSHFDPKYKDIDGYNFQDFRFQPATKQLSFFRVAPPGGGSSSYVVCDTHFMPLDSFSGSNGRIDGHDFQLNKKGERLYFSMIDTVLDASSFSGNPGDTAVLTTIEVIEIMNRDNRIVFKWNPLDFIPIHDTYQKLHDPSSLKPGTNGWDWCHSNSVSFTHDGDIIYSYRQLGVGKIDRETGKLLWKLGGKTPTIPVPSGGEYYQQHDFREIAPNIYSLFSNGDEDHASRAIVYSIDEKKLKAEVARIVEPSLASVYSLSMGSFNISENGMSVLNYGRYEVLAEKQPSFEIIDSTEVVRAVYSTPTLTFPYQVHLVQSWKPGNRPEIINEKGVLKVDSFHSFIKWFEVKGNEIVFRSEQFNFSPDHKGTYIAITEAGFGWMSSKPFEF